MNTGLNTGAASVHSAFAEPGTVRSRGRVIVCDLLSSSAPGGLRTLATEEAIRTAGVPSRCPILLGGQTVGQVARCAYQPSTGLWTAYGSLTGADALGGAEPERLIARPDLSVSRLTCPVCRREFATGDSAPCECLATAPVVLLKKYALAAVTLSFFRNENGAREKRDLAATLVARFFAGSAGELSFDAASELIQDDGDAHGRGKDNSKYGSIDFGGDG